MTTSQTSQMDLALPLPRLTPRGVALTIAAWLVYSLVYALAVTVFAGVPFAYTFPNQLLQSAILVAAGLPPWWLIVRGMAGRGGARIVLAHTASAVLYTVGTVALFAAVIRAGSAGAFEAVRPNLGWIALGTVLSYTTQFAIFHAIEAARRGRLRERQAERLRLVAREQELQSLRAQLNPHFLFNALNAVSAEVTRDPEEAREMLGQLGGLLRYSLDSGRRDLVPLAEEVSFVCDYLALEQARLGDRLAVTMDVDPALDAEIPPMALQTLVENAVRHGIAPAKGGGSLRVQTRRSGDHVEVRVEDTGVGASEESLATGGVGLANTDERLRLLFGTGLNIERDRASGFAVSFRLPLRAPAGDGHLSAVADASPVAR